MFLRHLFFPSVAACALIAAGQASAATLGASFGTVRAQYPDAEAIGLAHGARALEMRNVDYGGVHWRRVRFAFADGRHLAKVIFETQSSSYEQLIALAQSSEAMSSGVVQAGEVVSEDAQLRVCEGDDGLVSLTYEASNSTT